jgi:hypothetical protein
MERMLQPCCKTHNSTKKRCCAHKAPTTTIKTNCRQTGFFWQIFASKSSCKQSISSQQLPTWNKAVHFNNYYQINPKPQPKPETNLKKQPEKTRVHTKQFNYYQKEKSYHLSFCSS